MKSVVAYNKPIGVELEAGKRYHFCRCGRSDNQPFCDGSHRDTGFTPLAFTAEQDGKAFLCRCKQSGNQPFCDGSHKQVPDEQVGHEFSLHDTTGDPGS